MLGRRHTETGSAAAAEGTTVKVTVDPWSNVTESNESNNTDTASAVVGSGTPVPTASVSAAAGNLCLAKRPKPAAAHSRQKTAWPTIGQQGQIISNVANVSSGPSAPGTLSQGLAAVIPTLWDTGQTLRVRIDGFSSTDAATIQSIDRTWMNVVNINLVFVGANAAAEIRVAHGTGNNSFVGRDNLDVPADQPTMRLFNVTQRAILHEFGHALGWIHEHQSPVAGIKWDKPKVYAHSLTTQRWEKEKVDENLFKQYAASSTNYSAYDVDSIMHYTIDASLTTDGMGVTAKNSLSTTDTKYAREWYPFMGDTTGQLRTGDDCDTIAFRVDYDSNDAPANGYRFSLAEAEGKWWKAIKIPLKKGGDFELEVSESASTASFSADEIDTSRPMGFGKAKGLGIHTWLGYTWPVLASLPKKAKIQLTWTKDSCGG